MADAKLKASARARQLIAPLLAPSETPFKDYLKATDYCSAIMSYTNLQEDREYMAQWRAAFAALMVASDAERARLLTRLRADFTQGRSPLSSLMPNRR
ncbi:hypothetical protein G3480_14730 [Thiorhodococcus mannitoliphagus]|uniref:Uncharacterized protein n=1 Tax=Thiorhodococcus mannitoliphagus TaxID=329406 RepID=A0A6P1DUX4_9GAMM|nr:hypothetical protein [Thiorhodococcus mannitoliphagus]NEX21549.1 hypothetical protein [Thiorhodococcus mannitoliphagus]